MAVDLFFQEPIPGNPRPLDLVFGALDTSTSAQTGTLSVLLALPTVAVTADYDHNNAQRMFGGASSAWQPGDALRGGVGGSWGRGARVEAGDALPWAPGVQHRLDVTESFQRVEAVALDRALPWAQGSAQRQEAGSHYDDMLHHVRPSAGDTWQTGIPLGTGVTAGHNEMLRHVRPSMETDWQKADRLTRELFSRNGVAARRRVEQQYPWEQSRRPPAGITIILPPEPPIDEPCYTPPIGSAVVLEFLSRLVPGNTLIFRCREEDTSGTVVVPVQRVYIVINTTTLTRLSDGRSIPLLTASASLDTDSWVWSFSASVPSDQAQYLQDPTDLLQVSVNGTPFTFMPERLSRSRTFGQSSISVQGRGRQAALDSPYSPVETFGNTTARNASQLVDDVLTVNGVPLETAVTWNLTDWLVPAGAWSHQGSRISAINAIAAAVGGYVQPENVADGLRVLHRYPTAPWEWATATPDLVLPAAVVEQESIEWQTRTPYNRVFVSGASASGVLGQVTRAGTDGSQVAPMVTDALITHADAARQRGRAILGATGRAAMVSLRLPVLQATGVIRPGTFVQYNDGAVDRIGLSRSVQVALDGVETWQTIGVETYDEPV